MDLKAYLVEWTKIYLNHRKTFFRNIEKVEAKDDVVLSHVDGKVQSYFAVPNLEDFKLLQKECTIVTINSASNFKLLTVKWKKLASTPLTIIFINPFSQLDVKWIIKPKLHDKIAEPKSLKAGLKAMFETVESITENEFVEKIKSE